MKNKILIFSGVILFGVIVSYIAFGWSEPTGNMPSDYKAPINTSIEAQDVTEGKPVVANLDADKVDGYEASELLAATTAASGTSTLNLVVAQFAKNNPTLGFPDCPAGFIPISRWFCEYQTQNVISAFYDTYSNYRTRASLNGVDMPLEFKVPKNTQQASCVYVGNQYHNNTISSIGIKCVGDCSSCSDAASVSLTYSVCARDPLSGTFQGGTISTPSIVSLTGTRLISDIPYKGKLQISANINNGGENVTAKLYINNVLTETKTVTSSYSYIYEAPEGKTHSYKLQVINSVGSNEKTNSTWIGTIGGGMYIESDCTAAGGEVVTIQPGQRTCRFTQSSWTCPSGWTGYYNWSTAVHGYCVDSGPGHAWANIAPACYYGCLQGCATSCCESVTQRGCY